MSIDLTRIIDAWAGLQVTVVGDAMLDVYLEGSIGRLCREAPVPVVEVREKRKLPGGAANAAVNVHEMGGRVRFLSVVGSDREGGQLCEALRRQGVDAAGVLVEPDRRTLVKHRLVCGDQVLARFDEGVAHDMMEKTEAHFAEILRGAFVEADAVIVSDYGYGVLSPRLIRLLAQLQKQSPRVVVVDARQPVRYNRVGITAVKPSYDEALRILGNHYCEDGVGRAEAIAAQGERILNSTGAQVAAVTLDADGAVVVERNRPPYRTYAHPARSSRSVGAGDTFVGALGLALAAGADTPAAAELASAAAAVVLGKDGTATCSARELREFISGADKRSNDLAALALQVESHRGQGRRIVFTNGCFDILHRGHVTLLNRAKGLGDVLVVGVNSDLSVRRLKGPERPINALEDRIRVLAALSYVDHIVAFDGDTADEVIEAIRPDIFVKGGDYTRETLPEAGLVERLGGAVCIFPYVEDRSTTGIIERIRQAG